MWKRDVCVAVFKQEKAEKGAVVFSAVELGKWAEGAALCAHCGTGGGKEEWRSGVINSSAWTAKCGAVLQLRVL